MMGLPIPPESGPNEQKNNPENGRLRESQRQNAAESAQIIEVTFDRLTTLFRESLKKPPPEPETTSAEARSS
jgi:hypothetical protein